MQAGRRGIGADHRNQADGGGAGGVAAERGFGEGALRGDWGGVRGVFWTSRGAERQIRRFWLRQNDGFPIRDAALRMRGAWRCDARHNGRLERGVYCELSEYLLWIGSRNVSREVVVIDMLHSI